jgi:Na+-transporting methylmalonyl-CoA/oxaloacetate decarboxylase gamma subunit
MKRETIVGFVLVVLLFLVFPVSVYSGAAVSHGASRISAAQSAADRLS